MAQVTAGDVTQEVPLQVDTGATCSLLSVNRAKELFRGVAFSPSSSRLYGFGQQPLSVLGTLPTTVTYNNQAVPTNFYLVDTNKTEAIMGMDLLQALGVTLHPASHSVYTSRLLPYSYTVEYRPGRSIPVADALSRLPLPDTGAAETDGDEIVALLTDDVSDVITDDDVCAASAADPVMEQLRSVIRTGWPDAARQCTPETRDYFAVRNELQRLAMYRATPHCTTGQSPSALLHGRRMRLHLPVTTETPPRDSSLQHRVATQQQRNSRGYDSRQATRPSDLQPGDTVRVRRQGHVPKNQSRFSSPRRIARQLGPATFILSDGTKRNAAHLARIPDAAPTGSAPPSTDGPEPPPPPPPPADPAPPSSGEPQPPSPQPTASTAPPAAPTESARPSDVAENNAAPAAKQVLSALEEGGFRLHSENLKSILLADSVVNKPVVVISVAGAFRKGKSFLLDMMLRYLTARDKSSWLSEPRRRGFPWRSGRRRHTTGLLMWSQPVPVTLPDGTEAVILLMDTQGTFDNQSTMHESSTVFALSTLLSSVQIFNLMGNLQNDNLEHLQLFTEYGRLALQDASSTPFQKLLFLIRDWQFAHELPLGAKGGDELVQEWLDCQSGKPELVSVCEHIRKCFSEIGGFLLPHPGPKVAGSAEFDGSSADMDPLFVTMLNELMPNILAPKNLTVKMVAGNP
ncbi:Atlastin [Amphibalanus amphitrite]|uniref:Atlastin n=1 Tax=Amphibalanus amphitrite TaxID=1232801 RepID=A0A6A4UVG3_AMPAM|nr:Atlastin [Amphibalanus amphitrite]